MSRRRPHPAPPSRKARLERRALERQLVIDFRPKNLWEWCQIWRHTRPHRLQEIEAIERRCAGALKGWETRRRRAVEQGVGA